MKRFLRVMIALLVVAVGLVLRVEAQAGGGAVPAAPVAASGPIRGVDLFAKSQQLVSEAQPKGVIIRLDAPVDKMMTSSIKRRVDVARRMGCTVMVFELETNGGDVFEAVNISQIIKELAAQKIVTVAWVHHKALSAGSMIAASCQHIVTGSASQFGDCAPIAVRSTPLGSEVVPMDPTYRKKVESEMLGEFRDSAQRNHWNEDVINAMVVLQAELHELQNLTGQHVYVGNDRKRELLAMEVVKPGGVEKERPWSFVKTLDGNDTLYTMTSSEEAIKVGMSEGTIDSEQQLKEICNIRGDLTLLPYSWAENATVFLTEWEVRFVLFFGLLVFGILEFSHPGVMVFGIAAVLCLILLVGAPFLTGLAQIWEIALIVVGLAIIILDLLIFGGIDMMAIPGFILMAIGLIASFIPSDPGGFMASRSAWNSAATGLGVVVGGTFGAALFFYFAQKYLAITPGFHRLQLVPGGRRGAEGGGAAAVAVGGTEAVRDSADRPAGDAVFVGAIGRAATDLRPAGNARFGPHLLSVVSYGSFIEMDAEVEVLEISGQKIVVRPRSNT